MNTFANQRSAAESRRGGPQARIDHRMYIICCGIFLFLASTGRYLGPLSEAELRTLLVISMSNARTWQKKCIDILNGPLSREAEMNFHLESFTDKKALNSRSATYRVVSRYGTVAPGHAADYSVAH
jgi:hypothetical protein